MRKETLKHYSKKFFLVSFRSLFTRFLQQTTSLWISFYQDNSSPYPFWFVFYFSWTTASSLWFILYLLAPYLLRIWGSSLYQAWLWTWKCCEQMEHNCLNSGSPGQRCQQNLINAKPGACREEQAWPCLVSSVAESTKPLIKSSHG